MDGRGMKRAVAKACANIALLKYWGKNDAELNLPAVPSLSMTIREMSTQTEVFFSEEFPTDELHLNGKNTMGIALERISRHLDRITQRSSGQWRARVISSNDFPTAGGLASSASGFAALTLAAAHAFGLNLSERALSILARQGSGSAARSIYGGLAMLGVGTPGQVDSAYASPLSMPWTDVCLVVGLLGSQEKSCSSTQGMNQTTRTSPFFESFVSQSFKDMHEALQAISTQDLEWLGRITERSALRMHATMWAAEPSVVYFQPATLAALHVVQGLRSKGIPAWFTCDAGPHPKVLTTLSNSGVVKQALMDVPGIQQILIGTPGEGARLVASGNHA